MNQLEQFIHTARAYAYLLLVAGNLLTVTVWWACTEVFLLGTPVTLAIVCMVAVLVPMLLAWIIGDLFLRPLRFLWQAILYISPNTTGIPAPEFQHIHYGKDLVANLVNHVYQLADASHQLATATADDDTATNFVISNLPLPLLILDKHEAVVQTNNAFLQYIGKSRETVMAESVYSSLDLSFMGKDTFDAWLQQAKENEVTSVKMWERVRLTIPGDKPQAKLFDLAAYYNKDNPSGYETMLVLFDHTATYSRDDQAVNFVALAVHELRTPLTMLRGYIEALQEELDGKLEPELDGFMQKMQASAQQLSTFVNNILNVARVEEDQMMLKLQEADWDKTLERNIRELSLRAQVHGITLKTNIAKDLPTVGIDRVSIYEVLSNLIDNAIKYSADSKEIVISTELTKDGFVETTVQDFGVGIPGSAIPHLFEKFYRDYHNRQHVGGTGMGLYLCKTLISGHGGNIWVRSKEGQGSTFGFTLLPYAKLADELKNKDNSGIVHSAHGWIKNHSLYRR